LSRLSQGISHVESPHLRRICIIFFLPNIPMLPLGFFLQPQLTTGISPPYRPVKMALFPSQSFHQSPPFFVSLCKVAGIKTMRIIFTCLLCSLRTASRILQLPAGFFSPSTFPRQCPHFSKKERTCVYHVCAWRHFS